MLGAQDGERAGQAAQGDAAEGQGGCCTRSTRPRAETKAEKAFDLFVKTYEAKYPKATECLSKDREVLLTFYDFPAEHWVHIRTTNPIESTFATVRHRTERTKGCLTRDGMLAMIYKLGHERRKQLATTPGLRMARESRRGVKFRDGIEVKMET